MPDRMHILDTGCPAFTGEESTEEKVTAIQNYLYMLMEELRYLLRHLDAENFTDAGLGELAEGMTQAAQQDGKNPLNEFVFHTLSESLINNDELELDRLSTSRRIRKYILSDTSDDNYLLVQNNYLRMITGTVTGGSSTVQATNRNGRLLYWQKEPVGHNADGYPTDAQGNQIYATTKATSWPVLTYVYTETVKGSVALQNSGGVYVPEITLGAGDGNGNSRGFIWKDTDNLNIQLMNSEGDPVSIVLGDDGYVDVDKFRRATEMNFSGWSGGFFTEELDGAISVNYFVEFDNQERPIRIYDQTHSCDIVW